MPTPFPQPQQSNYPSIPNYNQPSWMRPVYGASGSGWRPAPSTQEETGSGLPNDLMEQIKTLMAQFGGMGGGRSPAPVMTSSSQPGMGQQYLQEIRTLMQKLSGGGLPQLSPEMQAELAQRKASMQGEIDSTFNKMLGSTTADLYGAGMERSGRANNNYADISGQKARAVSGMLSGLFGEEMGLRSQMGQNQTQGVLGQIQILRDLMNAEDQKAQIAQQNQQQNFQNSQVLAQNDEQRQMQMMEMVMQLIQRFARPGGGSMDPRQLVSATQFRR